VTLQQRINSALREAALDAFEGATAKDGTDDWRKNRIGMARGLRDAINVVSRAIRDDRNARRSRRRKGARRG
jgi:hypothetical protein